MLDDVKLISSGYVSDVSKLTQRPIRAQAGCADPANPGSLLRNESQWGLIVAVIGRTSSGPTTTRTSEWLAPALGCFALTKTVERLGSDGSWTTKNEYKTVRLDLSQAPDKLFVVPSDYTEVRPSELNRQLSQLMGHAGPPSSMDADFDQDYDTMRRRIPH